MRKINKNVAKKFFYCYLLFAICYLLSGCVTVPRTGAPITYNINGIIYLPLVPLCEQRGIALDYDTFTRTVSLSKDQHRINLRIGDNLVLVDGSARHIMHPIDIYQGTIVVPYKFKEHILDVLFKEVYPPRKIVAPPLKLKKIVVDAGHGGTDPGAIGRSGLREKDVNLDIAKRLSKLLRSEGIEVVMTRRTDRFIPLSSRVSMANNSRADLFVSIHANANRVRQLYGLEVYYVSPYVNDSRRAYATAKDTALNLDRAYFASSSLDLKAMLWDMIYTNSRAESIELSRSLCRSLDRNLDVRILGIKGGRFEVLRDVRMPAVLIETGFLSNVNEERKLKNSYYRQRIAEGISEGITDYGRDVVLVEAASR